MLNKIHVASVKTNHFFQLHLIEELAGKAWSNEFVFFNSEWYDSEVVLACFNQFIE